MTTMKLTQRWIALAVLGFGQLSTPGWGQTWNASPGARQLPARPAATQQATQDATPEGDSGESSRMNAGIDANVRTLEADPSLAPINRSQPAAPCDEDNHEKTSLPCGSLGTATSGIGYGSDRASHADAASQFPSPSRAAVATSSANLAVHTRLGPSVRTDPQGAQASAAIDASSPVELGAANLTHPPGPKEADGAHQKQAARRRRNEQRRCQRLQLGDSAAGCR